MTTPTKSLKRRKSLQAHCDGDSQNLRVSVSQGADGLKAEFKVPLAWRVAFVVLAAMALHGFEAWLEHRPVAPGQTPQQEAPRLPGEATEHELQASQARL